MAAILQAVGSAPQGFRTPGDGERGAGRRIVKDAPWTVEEAMKPRLIPIAVGTALAACASLAFAEDRVYRIDEGPHLIQRAPEWNLAANEGMCRLRVWVDDTARVRLQ